MPDALALLNVDDVCHLECLTWAVYDSVLMVGPWPKLLGDRSWCTVLAGLHKHIYRGHDDAAHCLPQTLGSWDCQEWIEALHQVGGLSSVPSGQRQASGPRGGPEAARNTAPRYWLGGLGMDIHMAHPPTCLRDITME